jgi:GNAT superfamily N-acetyltransferase
MRIEILSFEGCPNVDAAREDVYQALRLEGVTGDVVGIDVATIDDAERLRFLGSPSIRIDGLDVEAGAETRTDFGFMCRTYRTDNEHTTGPSVEMIRAAIRRQEQTKMGLPDGYIDLPLGKIAAIQTFLEMRERPHPRPDPPNVTATLQRMWPVDPPTYLEVFHKVGDPYLWFERLTMSRSELSALLGDPNQEVYFVEQDGDYEGLLELDFRTPAECEIRYFGLSDRLVGTGAGRWLMNRASEIAWSRPITRFWVHTGTLDHPNALEFYRRSGFVPYARKLELGDDPRILGIVPRDAAPWFPKL